MEKPSTQESAFLGVSIFSCPLTQEMPLVMAVGRRDCNKYSKRDLLPESGGAGERISSPIPVPFPIHTWLMLISGHGAAALVSGWKNWQGEPREQEHIPGRGTGRRESPMCVARTNLGCVCLRQTQSRSDCSENESKTETTKSNSVQEILAQTQRSQQRIRTEVRSTAYQKAVVFGLNLGWLSAVKT